jgi:precorrin-2/cobalt-factor-2 C20-methyltransferase
VERGTMVNSAMVKLADRPQDEAPYFSLVLVPGWEGTR